MSSGAFCVSFFLFSSRSSSVSLLRFSGRPSCPSRPSSTHLSTRDILNCALVSKWFRHVSSNDQIWIGLLLRDSQYWLPYAPAFVPQQGLGGAASYKDLYRSMSLEAHARRVVFSDHVGGNVSIENEGRGALHYSSYGTSKTEQTFSEGLHYVECLIDYKSHYCGVGCLNNEVRS